MSHNDNVNQEEWKIDDLHLTEEDLALAAEILGFPRADPVQASQGPGTQPVVANTPTVPLHNEGLLGPYGQHAAPDLPNFQWPQPLNFLNATSCDVPGYGQGQPFDNVAPFNLRPLQPAPAAPDIKQLLADRDNSWKGHIAGYEDYLRLKETYLSLNNEPRQGSAMDFPWSNAAQKQLVRQLYLAMTNMDGILDGTRLNRKRRHTLEDQDVLAGPTVDNDRFEDSVAVKRVKETSGIELEILSWELLYAIRDAQTGQDCIPAWSKDWERKRYSSFMERFNEVIQSLTKAKTVVSSLLNVSFIKRLAAAPERELHRKKDNKRLNMDRDISVKAGNYARKQGLVSVNENSGINTASGQQIAPPNPAPSHLRTAESGRGDRRTSMETIPRRNRNRQTPYTLPPRSVEAPMPRSYTSVSSSYTSTSSTPAPNSYSQTWPTTTSGVHSSTGTAGASSAGLTTSTTPAPASIPKLDDIDIAPAGYFDTSLFPDLMQDQATTGPIVQNTPEAPEFGDTSTTGAGIWDDFDLNLELSYMNTDPEL